MNKTKKLQKMMS